MQKNMVLTLCMFSIGLLLNDSMVGGGSSSKKEALKKQSSDFGELAEWSVAVEYAEVVEKSGTPASSKKLSKARQIRNNNRSKSKRYLVENNSESERD